MSVDYLPCPHDGCPGLEMHNGKPDGCGHPTITEGCPHAAAVPCSHCSGKGHYYRDSIGGCPPSTINAKRETCEWCGGAGRRPADRDPWTKHRHKPNPLATT
jgi:hypothetical protein